MKYLIVTLKHKWYVYLACLQMDVPLWRAIIHDLSKFTPSELPHYNRQFFGDKGDRKGFAYAWHHHFTHNPHHWEYWRFDWQGDPTYYDGIVENGCLEMPETYIREMIADWMGASRAYTGSWEMGDWLDKNLSKMKFHAQTRKDVYAILTELGYQLSSTNSSKSVS